jgi:hypothetical protein
MKTVSFLESLDVSFRAEPMTISTYEQGDAVTALYRFLVEAHPTDYRERGIRGILNMVARRDAGVSFAWEEVSWSDGTRLSEPESWVVLDLLLRHIAAQLLYQHAYFALKAGELQVTEESLDA